MHWGCVPRVRGKPHLDTRVRKPTRAAREHGMSADLTTHAHTGVRRPNVRVEAHGMLRACLTRTALRQEAQIPTALFPPRLTVPNRSPGEVAVHEVSVPVCIQSVSLKVGHHHRQGVCPP